jgi:ureidoacrylate peracid hydrolase
MVALSQSVELDARPEPVTLDLRRTAVLVIDMQNEFGAKGGMFDRAGIDITPIQNAVAPTAKVLAAARTNGIPVVYLKMQHRADMADMGIAGSPHRAKHRPFAVGDAVKTPEGRESRILIEGHWGTEIVAELKPEPGDIVIGKHRYSGFFETELDTVLRGLDVRDLVVTGCTTSVCVESTIRDAMFRDYHCVLLEDCTGEPVGNSNSRSNHEASLLTIQLLLGWTSESGKFITALSR